MTKEPKFKILSIDGGGIKGLYSSIILEHLERKYNVSCSDCFDMLCGTSTGGLIALGLSLKLPAKEMSKIYAERGKEIFPHRNKYFGLLKQTIWGGKYKALRKVLFETFGNRTIGESNNLLCIPSYSITDARPWIFKYDHKEHQLERDNLTTYVDVALATSAAPTYFPLAEIPTYNYKQFIDGGVWANNPALIGLIEALSYFVGSGGDRKYKAVQILSISSLNNTSGKATGLQRHRSFARWRNDLFETSLIGQSSFTDYMLGKLNELTNIPIEYVRIPSESISAEQQQLIQLDNASDRSIQLISGKANDRGTLSTKDPAISKFFQTPKSYYIN